MTGTPNPTQGIDNQHMQGEFHLIAPPTQDLLAILINASWGDDDTPFSSATLAMEAIEGGAELEPGSPWRWDPLYLVAMGWGRSVDYRKAFLPVLHRIASQSSQSHLDKAISLGFCSKEERIIRPLIKTLQHYGGHLSSNGLLEVNLAAAAGRDGTTSKIIAMMDDLGWIPCEYQVGEYHREADLLKTIIEVCLPKSLNTLVGIYEKHDLPIPARLMGESISPMCHLYQQQMYLKKSNTGKIKQYNEMIERMAHSGLLQWEDGAFLDWKKGVGDWIIEAAVEGEGRRLARNTDTPAPTTSRRHRL